MADSSVIFTEYLKEEAKGNIDLDGDTIKALLIADPANTSWDPQAERDFATLSALGGGSGMSSIEHDGSYTRITVSGLSVTSASGSVKVDCTDPVFSSVASGTYGIGGILLYKHITDDTDAIPIVYIKASSLITATGADVTANINAAGLFTKGQA